ncbi:hypothetical protein [Pleomorphomonas sp. JP5]
MAALQAWIWAVERQAPRRWDLTGAAIILHAPRASVG